MAKKIPFYLTLLATVLLFIGTSAPAQDSAPSSSESMLFPIKQDGKWGFIDKTGAIIIKPQFDGCIDFENQVMLPLEYQIDLSNDLIPVKVSSDSGKWGYIDKTGNFVINPQFDYFATPFAEGLATVSVNNKLGYIDKSGNCVIKPQFDDCNAFTDGWLQYR